MGAHYGILVQRVKSVNDASLEILRKHHIDAGFSLRCDQRFGKDVINHFAAARALLNLHPGILLSYRRETTAEQASFGYSLRHVSSSDNSGPVLDVRTILVDYEKSVFHHMNDLSPIGAEMVLDAVDKLARGKDIPAIEQDEAESRYYSCPTEEGLGMLRKRGMKLVDAAAIEEVLVDNFAANGGRDALREVVREVVVEWYGDEGASLPEEKSYIRNTS